MSKLEDFEDIPYEDEPKYTLNDVQEMPEPQEPSIEEQIKMATE